MKAAKERVSAAYSGPRIRSQALRIAKATIEKFVARATRLYEQDRKEPLSPSRLDKYVKRWLGWAGIHSTVSRNVSFPF